MAKIKTKNTATGLDMNEFIPIQGHPGYSINRKGEVLGKQGRIMKSYANEKGYHYIVLTNDKKAKNCRLHRLVAQTFILKGTRIRDCVNHIDGDKNNNGIRNLEWTTQQENIMKRTRPSVRLTEPQRIQIRKTLSRKYKTLRRKDVYDRLVKKYGISRDYLSNINYSSAYSA